MGKAKRRVRNIALVTAAFALGGFVMYLLDRYFVGIPCVFSRITGLNCPGCGNTAAAVYLIGGDLLSALRENYLFPLEFFYLGWVYVLTAWRYYQTGKAEYKPPLPALDIILLVVLVLWGVVRNFFGL